MEKIDKTAFVDFGNRIKVVRKKLRISQKDFAASIGYSACYLSEIESGRKNPNLAFFFKLLEIHKLNINYLLSGEGDIFLRTPEPQPPVDDREYIDVIKTKSDLDWFMERSTLFRDAIMASGAKYHLENESSIKKSLNRG